MKEKDADLNRRVKDAAFSLSYCDNHPGFIDPKRLESIRSTYKGLRKEALRYIRSVPHTLGFYDKGLDSNIRLFLKRYDDFPNLAREQNFPITVNRLNETLRLFESIDYGNV